MGAFLSDVRFAARRLLNAPMFAVFTLVLLALATGANTAIFSLLDAFALRDLPVSHPEQLVRVATPDPDYTYDDTLSLSTFREIGRRQQVFSALLATGRLQPDVEIGGALSRVYTLFVTGNFYAELGTRPFAGRLLTPGDDRTRAGTFVPAAVIGYDYWQRRFGSDGDVIGRTIRIEDVPFTIVGIAPKHFSGLGLVYEPDLTIPLGAWPVIASAAGIPPDFSAVYVVGRLKPGVTLAHASAQLQSVWPSVREASIPASYRGAQRDQFLARPLIVTSAAKGAEQASRSELTHSLVLAMAIAWLMLVIACVNLASLTLSRVATRRHEIRVRVALGASRWQIARPILVESGALALLGAMGGWPLAGWAIVSFRQWTLTGDFPATAALGLAPDVRVLAFVSLVALSVGLLVSLSAVVWVTRRHQDMSLTGGSRITRERLGSIVVGTQMALSLMLITTSGLLVRNLQELRGTRDLHYRREGVTIVALSPRPHGYTHLDTDTYLPALIEQIAAIPGVRAASLGSPPTPDFETRQAVSPVNTQMDVDALFSDVSPGFFRTLEIPLLQGRDFTWRDNSRVPRVVILSQSLARHLFGDTSAIGRHVRIGTRPSLRDIAVIGVVADAKLYDFAFRRPTPFTAYVAELQAEETGWYTFLLRSDTPSGVPSAAVRRAVESFGHDYVVSMRTLAQATDADLVIERLIAQLAACLSTLALVLAAIGLYAMLSYAITRQRKELGIRLALGANPRRLVVFVAASGLKIAVIGVGLGVVGTLVTNRLLASRLTGISPFDPFTMIASPILLLLVAVAACAGPAVRAAQIDPIVTLRAE